MIIIDGQPTAINGTFLELATQEDGEYSLDEIKSIFITRVKINAAANLSQTDWKVIKYRDRIELGLVEPNDSDYIGLLQERQAIRDQSNELEAAVNAATEINGLLAIEL